jgi:hypothetical protein
MSGLRSSADRPFLHMPAARFQGRLALGADARLEILIQ